MAIIHFQSPARKKGAKKSARKRKFSGDRCKAISTSEPLTEERLCAERIATYVKGIKNFAVYLQEDVSRLEALSLDGECKMLSFDCLAGLLGVTNAIPHLLASVEKNIEPLFQAAMKRNGL